ncbi:MAG TPA: hypothetical protein VMU54_23070, partial [Planctomycetota bacterium]|nr:hypothetical protein [Planctomycetota bacterium]
MDRLEGRFDYSSPGEALLHHSPDYHSAHLPLSDVFEATVFTHNGGIMSVRTFNVVFFAAAAALCSSWTYSLSPLLFSSSWQDNAESIQIFFTILVLLCGLLLMWRARKPSWRRSLVLGLAVGATLLYRSPLAFFPPVLVLYEWNFLYHRSLRRYWKHLISLGLTPYLFLLPWVFLHWRSTHRFVLLENGEADCNIVTGALGLVHTVEGPWQSLAGLQGSVGGGRALTWAMHRISEHPFVYLAACLGRLWFVFSLHPFLIALACLSLWLHRRREEYRQLGLLGAYFISIHCLMSVEPRYFVPLWPLASIAAAALIDRVLPFKRVSRTSCRLSRWTVSCALVLVLLACLGTELLVGSRALAPLTERVSSSSVPAPDAWLSSNRAWRRLKENDLGGAEKDLASALARSPLYPGLGLWLSWLQMLRGHPQGLFIWENPQRLDGQTTLVEHLLKAQAFLRYHRPLEMERELEAALRETSAMIFTRGHAIRDQDTLQTMQASAGGTFLDRARP